VFATSSLCVSPQANLAVSPIAKVSRRLSISEDSLTGAMQYYVSVPGLLSSAFGSPHTILNHMPTPYILETLLASTFCAC
jgi:hypothetical protein